MCSKVLYNYLNLNLFPLKIAISSCIMSEKSTGKESLRMYFPETFFFLKMMNDATFNPLVILFWFVRLVWPNFPKVKKKYFTSQQLIPSQDLSFLNKLTPFSYCWKSKLRVRGVSK